MNSATMQVFLEPYNPNWKTDFENIRQVIEVELDTLRSQIDIQHVGSTSVPGLLAKPILDVDIIINDKDLLKDISVQLERIGYQYKGEQGITGRFAFGQSSGFVPLTNLKRRWQPHHLYVCYSDSLAVRNHLLFRDALRNDTRLAQAYSQLKQSLTEDASINREAYTKRKTDFIISVLKTYGFSDTELEEIINANV